MSFEGPARVFEGEDTAMDAILAGSMAEGKAPLREKAFREAVAKNPGMEVVVTEDVKWMNIPFDVNYTGRKGYREFLNIWTAATDDRIARVVPVQ